MNQILKKVLTLQQSFLNSNLKSTVKHSVITPRNDILRIILEQRQNSTSRFWKAKSKQATRQQNAITMTTQVFKYFINSLKYANYVTDLNTTAKTRGPLIRRQALSRSCQIKTAVLFIVATNWLYLSLPFLNGCQTVGAASSAAASRNFIADIVAKAIPAVVFIEIKGRHPKSGKRVTLANGSGFIVRCNGLILTNAHVVANKPKVIVKLHDGSTYEGTVTAVDPVCDLATVKIDCENDKLPTIPLGKSSTIRPGEFVAAMGSPLSLHKTVTVGIVSSHLRGSKELGMNNKNMEYIQTDATIGLGNSGGPLVNLDGKAIGINTLKLTEGISFAIPADYAVELLEKAEALQSKADANNKPNYIANGKEAKKRRYMGITMLPLTETIIMELKDKIADFPDITGGVYVHKVVVSSPAYAGGLHAGDIIIDINGFKIESPSDVFDVLEKSEILRVTVIRGRYKEKYSVVTETL
ncbi:hypothetical protein BsWGS_14815 [Bradybaena similaris]